MAKEIVAMLLAGGQGSRLYALTQNLAKPAVPFGGKYRIIDFPLSNCVNSGIDTVGILTQYQPVVLNEYIGNGQPWDLDRLYGGVHVLPPYQKATGSDWFKGTANAIYQHISSFFFYKEYRLNIYRYKLPQWNIKINILCWFISVYWSHSFFHRQKIERCGWMLI